MSTNDESMETLALMLNTMTHSERIDAVQREAVSETWCVEFRLAWIKESVEIFGHINRQHIVRKFRVSQQQASEDISKVVERWPELMSFNSSTKRYERNGD